MDQQLSAISKAMYYLEEVNIENRSITYNTLLRDTKHVLFENCLHEVETDLIDITPDKSVNIVYCSICNLTFTVEYIYSYLQDSLSKVDKDRWKLHYNNNIYNLLSFFIKNNKIIFSIILKKNVFEHYTFSLDSLINCNVMIDTVEIK